MIFQYRPLRGTHISLLVSSFIIGYNNYLKMLALQDVFYILLLVNKLKMQDYRILTDAG